MFADAHIHLGNILDSEAIALRARRLSEEEPLHSSLLAVSCTPNEYLEIREKFADHSNVCVALGLHPWQVSEEGLEAFCRLASNCRYIGEVGLDFYKEHARTKELQLEVFDKICGCLEGSEHVVSLHTRAADMEALDILEAHGLTGVSTCILHAFNGSSQAMTRALRLGCRFSFGLRELRTKRGREYVRQLPAECVLAETDAEDLELTAEEWAEAIAETRALLK